MDQTSSDNRTDQPFTIRKAETNEDLQEIAALADVIWHEHFTPIIGKEQVEYMLSRFQSYPALQDQVLTGYEYYRLLGNRKLCGFMIQGGCPNGNGMGGPGYAIKGEFAQNGFQNDLAHDPGVLSMARAMHPDSAGSQFFIMHEKSPHLDGAYAAFGKITEGMDIVNKIAETATDYSDRPLEEQRMKKVTVELFGETYDEPETV